jgi:arylsulfatase A-like enzyme
MRFLKSSMRIRVLLLFMAAAQIFVSCQSPEGDSTRKVVLDLVEDFQYMEPVVETGRIDFSSQKAGPLLLDGWGGLFAGQGLWATDFTSTLRFFSFSPASHLKAVIRCAPLLEPGSPDQRMEVYLNGKNEEGFITALTLKPDPGEYTLNFPKDRIVRGENIITFSFSRLEKPGSQDPAEERRDLRAVYFEWLRFPDALSGKRHIYRQDDTIFIDPLARMRYHLRVPDDGRLSFELGLQSDPHQVSADREAGPVFSVSIREDGSEPETVFEERMIEGSAAKKRHEVDLSSRAGRIVRLTFQLEHAVDPGTEASSTYAAIGRPRIEGYDSLRRAHDAVPNKPELRGIEKSNLIVILLDAANPSHFGGYGYERDTTPNIDRLARDGVLFSQAYAHAPNTRASTASLFTSTYPPTHRVIAPDTMLSDEAVSWAEGLRDAGFKTFAATSNVQVSPVYNLLHGFDETVELYKDKKGGVVLAQEFLAPVGEWLETNRSEQFFMYLHVLQPHAPYNPPPPAGGAFSSGYTGPLKDVRRLNPRTIKLLDLRPEDLAYLVAKYDENLLYADSFVGDLVGLLSRYDLLEDSILLITADHGEAFLTHGHVGHSSSVYDDEVRIPLIMRFPARYDLGGQKIGAVVQSIDLMPTFLDLFEAPYAGQEMQGRSLLPLLVGQSDKIHEDIATFFGRLSPEGTQVASALRGERYKFFEYRSRRYLFDLQADPAEQINIYLSKPVIAGYYVQRLKKLQREWSEGQSLAAESKISLDEDIKEQLRSLGYIK